MQINKYTYDNYLITLDGENINIKDAKESIDLSITELSRAVTLSSPAQNNFNGLDLKLLRYINNVVLNDYYKQHPEYVRGRIYSNFGTNKNIYRCRL